MLYGCFSSIITAMHSLDEDRPKPHELAAFKVHVDGLKKFEPLAKYIGNEHTLAHETLESGTEALIEIPPTLDQAHPTHNSQNRITTSMCELQNQTHIQAKRIDDASGSKPEFKNGTGDFNFFIHLRKPGLYTLSLNCMFDGLSPITKKLWKEKLDLWQQNQLNVDGAVVSLDLPDVAFSQMMRHFFSSAEFKNWLNEVDRSCTENLVTELNSQPVAQLIQQPKDIQERQLSRTAADLNLDLEGLIFALGKFRNKVLYGEKADQNGFPFNQLTDAWYLNGIFGITANLVVEPLTVFESFQSATPPEFYHPGRICVISNSLRSRADIAAYTGAAWNLTDEETALASIKQETWLSDGNAQIDNLIYQLQKVSSVIEQVTTLLSHVTGGKWLGSIQEAIAVLSQLKKTEAEFEYELLLKPWTAYAVLPPDSSPEFLQALRATTHSTSALNVLTGPPLISVTATDGATTTTRDALKRKVTSVFGDETAKAIRLLIKNAVNLSPKDLSEWLNDTLHTADDRSVQDQKISRRPYLTAREFEQFAQAAKEMLNEYEPVVK